MAELLIMEPDPAMNRDMCALLTGAGHICHPALNVAEGLAALSDGVRMTTVLNAQMPWSESIAFLRALEEKGLPVLFLTSEPANAPHLRALYASCCEVLLLPYDPAELTAAVARLLETSVRQLHFGPIRMDVDARTVSLAGVPLTLTAQEFALLQVLMESPDKPITREHLLRTAWGYEGMGITRTVDVHIQRLRRKLGRACIETVYKTGYRLKLA